MSQLSVETGCLLRTACPHSPELCPLYRLGHWDQIPALVTAPTPTPTPAPAGARRCLTSTLQRRSLKPQVPLLEEQHKALRTPSHSALSDLQ